MLYFRNPDDLLIPNMIIDTSPSSSCSRQSPGNHVPAIQLVLQGRVYHRFGIFHRVKSYCLSTLLCFTGLPLLSVFQTLDAGSFYPPRRYWSRCARLSLPPPVQMHFIVFSQLVCFYFERKYSLFAWVGDESQRKSQFWMNGHFIKPNFAKFLLLDEWRSYKAKYCVVWI